MDLTSEIGLFKTYELYRGKIFIDMVYVSTHGSGTVCFCHFNLQFLTAPRGEVSMGVRGRNQWNVKKMKVLFSKGVQVDASGAFATTLCALSFVQRVATRTAKPV